MRYAQRDGRAAGRYPESPRPGSDAIYLFGSRARADALPTSDYDIGLLAAGPLDPIERWKLQEELASELGAHVDLVDLWRASAVLRAQVLKDAVLLFDGARSQRELFEATALSDHARLNEERRAILADTRERGRIHG